MAGNTVNLQVAGKLVSAGNPLPVVVDVAIVGAFTEATAQDILTQATATNTKLDATNTKLDALKAVVGAPDDAVGANTVIGLLKQIAENTAPVV